MENNNIEQQENNVISSPVDNYVSSTITARIQQFLKDGKDYRTLNELARKSGISYYVINNMMSKNVRHTSSLSKLITLLGGRIVWNEKVEPVDINNSEYIESLFNNIADNDEDYNKIYGRSESNKNKFVKIPLVNYETGQTIDFINCVSTYMPLINTSPVALYVNENADIGTQKISIGDMVIIDKSDKKIRPNRLMAFVHPGTNKLCIKEVSFKYNKIGPFFEGSNNTESIEAITISNDDGENMEQLSIADFISEQKTIADFFLGSIIMVIKPFEK